MNRPAFLAGLLICVAVVACGDRPARQITIAGDVFEPGHSGQPRVAAGVTVFAIPVQTRVESLLAEMCRRDRGIEDSMAFTFAKSPLDSQLMIVKGRLAAMNGNGALAQRYLDSAMTLGTNRFHASRWLDSAHQATRTSAESIVRAVSVGRANTTFVADSQSHSRPSTQSSSLPRQCLIRLSCTSGALGSRQTGATPQRISTVRGRCVTLTAANESYGVSVYGREARAVPSDTKERKRRAKMTPSRRCR